MVNELTQKNIPTVKLKQRNLIFLVLDRKLNIQCWIQK